MNLGFEVGFDRPWFLLLLLLLPAIWALSFNSLAGLGSGRRFFALAMRTLVMLLLVMALAEAKWQRSTDRLTVMYLLDQSESIPVEKRQFMLDYVYHEVSLHRREDKKDKAGVIVFGGNAKIESAPFDGELPLIGKIEANVDLLTASTSLEAGLKLARAAFPEDTARRVVIISDGNENVGDSLAIAQAMAEDGIGIDVVPIELLAGSEVSVDKVVLPTDIRKGQAFETKVVLTNDSDSDGNVSGKLRLIRKTAQTEELVAEQQIELTPGKNIIGFNSKLDRSAVYTTEAVFVPDEETEDLISQNNRASAFTQVRGKGKVLLIEDAYHSGEFLHLIERLQANSIEVETMKSSRLYTTSAELLQYDSVILGNVPRAAGDDTGANEIQSFSDAQIKMLVDNCEHMGCGIVMLGGDRSFGAGGWSNSLLEKAMPVDFQIKNDKVSAVGALALMMHASEMANGNYWQVRIGEEAIKVLGPMDYCGVIDWSDYGGTPRWLWKMPSGVDRVFRNRNRMLGMVNRMTPGDMPDFNAPMKVMLNGLKRVNASLKHVIIISDGDPTPPTNALLQGFVQAKIKISTVAVGTHGPAGSTPLQRIANVTGGSYYVAKNPKALPKIYQREARRVAKPVIKESKTGMSVIAVPGSGGHEIMSGIDPQSLPPHLGYVMTTRKKSNLVEQLALSSEPANDGGENSTLLATWRYGNGRTIAFTSDAGHKWTSQWFNNEQYDKLFVQMVRHSMRPITQSANFTVAAESKNGIARIVVTALDDKEELLNFLEMSGHGINSSKTGDDDRGISLEFNQIGPGRYAAEHPIEGSGNLLYTIFPGEGYERLNAGINVPYSSEYSDRESNLSLLDSLAQFKPRGGQPGEMASGDLSKPGLDELLQTNTFRPTLSAAIGIQDIWPLLLMLCGTAFFSDVFVRRVAASPLAILGSFIGVLGLFWLLSMIVLSVYDVSGFADPGNEAPLRRGPLLLFLTCLAVYVSFYLSFFITSDWMKNKFDRVRAVITRKESGQPKASISRLQSRKAEIEREIESRRASTKFEPSGDQTVSGKKKLEEVLASEIEKTPALPPKIKRDKLDVDGDHSYTSRLLDAKRKVQQQRDRGKKPDDDS